jgi:hypothetical protein
VGWRNFFEDEPMEKGCGQFQDVDDLLGSVQVDDGLGPADKPHDWL